MAYKPKKNMKHSYNPKKKKKEPTASTNKQETEEKVQLSQTDFIKAMTADNFRVVADGLYEMESIGALERDMYIYLIRYANLSLINGYTKEGKVFKQERPVIFPSQKTVAKDLRISQSSVSRIMKNLANSGLVYVIKRHREKIDTPYSKNTNQLVMFTPKDLQLGLKNISVEEEGYEPDLYDKEVCINTLPKGENKRSTYQDINTQNLLNTMIKKDENQPETTDTKGFEGQNVCSTYANMNTIDKSFKNKELKTDALRQEGTNTFTEYSSETGTEIEKEEPSFLLKTGKKKKPKNPNIGKSVEEIIDINLARVPKKPTKPKKAPRVVPDRRNSVTLGEHFREMYSRHMDGPAPAMRGRELGTLKLLLTDYGYDHVHEVITWMFENYLTFQQHKKIYGNPHPGLVRGYWSYLIQRVTQDKPVYAEDGNVDEWGDTSTNKDTGVVDYDPSAEMF